jgi:hypothetical protein
LSQSGQANTQRAMVPSKSIPRSGALDPWGTINSYTRENSINK